MAAAAQAGAATEQQQQQQQHPQQEPQKSAILLTPYPIEPGHTLVSIARQEWRPEMRAQASFVAEGDNAGIVINKPANIMDYNRAQAAQKERLQAPSAKLSFKVFLINSDTGKLTLEHRTLRFWLRPASSSAGRMLGAAAAAAADYADIHAAQQDQQPRPADGSAPATAAASADIQISADQRFESTRSFANIKHESSQLAQAYFCQLIGAKPDDDFPKNYVAFLMKLMRLLKLARFERVHRMEVELRQLAHDDSAKPPSRSSSLDGSQHGGEQGGRGSPLTNQRVLDVIESAYPNPISIGDICQTLRADEPAIRQLVEELAACEKVNSTDNGQHFTRCIKPIDTKVNMVKQMPNVNKSQQPVIAIITAQYCEKLAVDAMISDKETFVRYRTNFNNNNNNNLASNNNNNNHHHHNGQLTAHKRADSSDSMASSSLAAASSSANYVYTLGNIGEHRVVSTKLTALGNSRGALIAAGNATTRLLGTFPEIEYVFLVGCAGGVANYTDFSAHVRLGDVVVSHLAGAGELEQAAASAAGDGEPASAGRRPSAERASDSIYVHCKPKRAPEQQAPGGAAAAATAGAQPGLPVSYSIHRGLSKATTNGLHPDHPEPSNNNNNTDEQQATKASNGSQPLAYDQCHFRLWRPAKLELQELARRLWLRGLEKQRHRIWEYYIEEGAKSLGQLDVDASRPSADTDKLFMSIGPKDAIEVSHPEAADDELDLRRDGKPMCHFGPIGSGKPLLASEPLRQRLVAEFGLRALDAEFDPVVESIYGNCKESYVLVRGISDYRDGRKRSEWQQYSALVAAAFVKSIIVNLKHEQS